MVASAANSRFCLLIVLVSLLVAPVLLTLSLKAWAEPLPRAASINVCTDQLLMLLAEPQQIVALSSLGRDKAGSYFYENALNFPQVEPIAEDILALAPDLVVTGPYTSRYTLGLLDELGIRIETLPIANSIDDMLDNVKCMGSLLHQQSQAETIVKNVQQRLDAIDGRVQAYGNTNKPKAAVYDTNGYTVGRQTVRGQTIELSGWSNVATSLGIDSYGVLGLEQLITLEPQVLIESPYSAGSYSRGQMLTQHPAIKASGLDPLIVRIPSNQTICAGPWTIDVIEKLEQVRAEF